MLTVDLKSYTKSIDHNELESKEQLQEKLKKEKMNGFLNIMEKEERDKIKQKVKEIKSHSSLLVVVGIGGSYMGCYALDKMTSSWQKSPFPLIYAGYQLNDQSLKQLRSYLLDKDFSLNVISKSGTTLETTLAFQELLDLLKEKYPEEEVKKRVIITTDEKEGSLRKQVEEKGYTSFTIPENVGGRYSVLTSVGLFPLATILDIDLLLDGYADGLEKYQESAYQYACFRKKMADQGRVVENFVVYEEKYLPFCEWLKQLFAESEGKNNQGILPISTFYTRDLHSLGQFFQEGTPIAFETVLKLGLTDEKQTIALESVCKAHQDHTPNIVIETSEVSEYTIGELIALFYLSAVFSSYLFGVNPFDQPGVEKYKEEMKKRWTKI